MKRLPTSKTRSLLNCLLLCLCFCSLPPSLAAAPTIDGFWQVSESTAEFDIQHDNGKLSIQGQDAADGEAFVISQVQWDGRILKADFLMPSTQWLTHSELVLEGNTLHGKYADGTPEIWHRGDALSGSFGHQYTSEPKQAVWSIKSQNGQFTLTQHGDNTELPAHKLSVMEIRAFWGKMQWDESSVIHAECIGTTEDIFCRLPQADRINVAWLRDYRSNYFYYSAMTGVMEIFKLTR